MNVGDSVVDIWRTIIVGGSKSWVLFENDTCVILVQPASDLREQAKAILREWGPVHVGTPAGDFTVVTLSQAPGWVVKGHHNDVLTYVAPDELGANPPDLMIGLHGRSKRNQDGEQLRIVHVEDSRSALPSQKPQPPEIKQSALKVAVVEGDLLDQDVEVIVNAWNRNIIPWWLLLPQGVSGAIKKRAGYAPFRELSRKGAIPLGGAVETGAGRLPFKAIIHVAGISMFWRSSKRSIRDSVQNAIRLAASKGYKSIAFPLIGAGTGGSKQEMVLAVMLETLKSIEFDGEVRIVRYRKS